MVRRFEILDANTRHYRRYNAVGRQLTVPLIPLSNSTKPVTNFLANVNDLIEHKLRDVEDSDTVRMTIQNQVNQNEGPEL